MQSRLVPCAYSHGPPTVTLAAIPAGGYDARYKAWKQNAAADIGNDNYRTNESQPWVSRRRT